MADKRTLSLPRLGAASRRHQVSDILRKAITSGDLRPGDRLVELELSAQLGTSRAPVREALRQLEQEGLVVSYPYRGTEVLSVSQEEIEHVLVPIRLTIERFAFTRAMPKLGAEDLDHLAGLVEDMRHAADAADADRVADADLRFHDYVIAKAEQPHCLQIWHTIQPRVWAYFRRDAPAHPGRHTVAEQHRQLLEAIASGDEARLLATLDAHIHLHLSPPAGDQA
jgi:DNA-binding GntR family transcriptional regulator